MRKELDKNLKKKKQGTTLRKRIIALVLSFAMLLTAVYVPELGGLFKDLPSIVHAATTPTSIKNINSLYELYDFSNNYTSANKGARITINISGDFVLEADHSFTAEETGGEAVTLSYVPIGTAADPFEGEIRITQAYNTPQIIRGTLPLFGYIRDDVEIYRTGTTDSQQLSLIRSSESSEPLFARNVVAKTEGSIATTWNFLISPFSETEDDVTTVSAFDFGGIIGSIGDGTTVNMTVDNAAVDGSGNGANIVSDDNAGLICGSLGTNSTVNVTFSGKSSDHSLNETYSVTTNGSGKSAGGFIGEMNSGSTLNIYLPTASTNYDIDAAKTIDATAGGTSYAGGVVGNNMGGAVNIFERTVRTVGEKNTVTDTAVPYVSKDTVKAKTGAGGIFGYYLATADTNWAGKFATDATGCIVNAANCGGYAGILDGAGFNVTFAGTSSNHLSVKTKLTAGESIDNFGGLVGKYLSKDLTKTLDCEYVDVTMAYSSEPAATGDSAFGGLVGYIDGSDTSNNHTAVYMKADNVSVTATSGYSKATYFGGIVGKTGDKGSLLDIGSVTVSTNGNNYKGGGIVGQINAGVLRLSGKTDLTNAPARKDKSTDGNQTSGQIVGYRASALIYALGTGTDSDATYENGWCFDRYSKTNSNYVDDIGNWGEVVRFNTTVQEEVEGVQQDVVKNIEDSTYGVLSYSSSAHTVTVAAPQTEMDSNADLVATALNMQLNEGSSVGALCFSDTTNKSSELLKADLVIDGALSFANTGLTGFTRDNGHLDVFTGSLSGKTGNSADSITLAVGESYGNYTSGKAGSGEIYAHLYNGLFGKIDGASISNITIYGSINHCSNVESVRIGGLAAEINSISKAASISNVVLSETINFAPVKAKKDNYVGGVAGWVSANNDKNIAITSATLSPTIIVTDTPTGDDLRIGGAIGYVQSTKTFEIGISSSTISPNITATAGSARKNWAMAGLIADIQYNGAKSTSDTRTVALSNNTITACEVKNNVSETTGGLLGYKWFNTNVTLTSNTFSSANLLYTDATDFSALCYKATGYWQVASSGLDIDSLTIADKDGKTRDANAVESFGFIVDYGYHNSNSDKSAIYLEMQAADSFTLGSDGAGAGVSVPSMTEGVYDELVAYTSDDVLTNKSGVISYYTTNNGTLYMNKTNCNSYQNVFNKTLTNGNSRYYYNYYQNKANTSSDAWKTLRWSLSVYSADNISAQFENPFGTGAVTLKGDLSGVSYYPVDVDSGVTLNVSSIEGLIFHNYRIEKSEAVTSANGNTDGSTRSTLLNTSQHYLMHTGLFRNISGSVNLTGKARFQGTIGVTSDYSGVFINGKLTGSVTTSSSNAITFGNGGSTFDSSDNKSLQLVKLGESGAESTNEGYLFINKIEDGANLVLNKVRINYGASTGTYARSLIGNVVGKNIYLEFNDIRIDSRKTTDAPATLTTVYKTKKSIFKYATLLNSFDGDSTSNAIYNFAESIDWGTNTTRVYNDNLGVTYGKEITDSQAYNGKEKWYYDSTRYYIDAETKSTSTTGSFSFSTGYLPYVRYSTPEASGNTYSGTPVYGLREIKVNVKSVNITSGCGTYDHPYLIDSPDQLIDIAATINGNTLEPIGKICLPKTVATQANNYNDHWCYDSVNSGCTCDAEYVYSDLGYTSSATGANPWTLDQVREYLAGAYYQISGSIVLRSDSGYVGLGASSSTQTLTIDDNSNNSTGRYAFRGVIIGVNGGTVTNYTTVPLIKISNGCVVKKLVVNVNTQTAVVGNVGASTAFGYTQPTALCYGGVIGEIMGGDNIIDHVKVTYAANASGRSINADKAAPCIGGYVGAVVNGGLVFRNMTADDIAFKNSFKIGSTSLDYATENKTSRLYNNVFVGRVINGYAINETGTYTENVYNNDGNYSGDSKSYTLDNSKKNYRIADVNPQDVNKLSVTTFTPLGASNPMKQLSIPNGQSLFILSLITQSGAGTATSATGDYAYGIGYEGTTRYDATAASAYSSTHLAKYDSVGTTSNAIKNSTTPVTSGSLDDYAVAFKDTTANKKAVPYIIFKYTTSDGTSYPLRMVTGYGTTKDNNSSTLDEGWYLKLSNTTDNYVYNLPDCFRGIGSICRNISGTDEDGKFSVKLYCFDGNGKTININLYNHVYQNGNDNYQNKVYGASKIYIGYGLFNSFKQITEGNTVQANVKNGYYIGNFKLGGKIEEIEYDTSGNKMVACGLRNAANNGNGSKNSPAVGGVVGALTHSTYVNFYDLDLYNLDIDAYSSNAVGGYIGRTNITEIDSTSGEKMSNIYANGCDTDLLTINATQAGCGGILGVSYSGYASIYVNTLLNEESHPKKGSKGADGYYKSEMKMSITDDAYTLECGLGGIVGCVRNGYNMNLWFNNVTIAGNDSNSKLENPSNTDTAVTNSGNSLCSGVGGLIGYIRKGQTVYITNTEVKNINIRGPQAGGMFGNIAYEYDTKYISYGLPPLVKIYNSKVYVDDTDHEYDITGIKYTGGISGQFTTDLNYSTGARVSPTVQSVAGYNLQDVTGYKGDSYTYDIDNCEVYGYTIAQSGSSTGTGVGGIIGNASCGDSKSLVGTSSLPTTTRNRSIVNTSVHDCIIKTNNNANNGLGGIIGYATCTVYGYNVVSYNNTFAGTDNGSTLNAKTGSFLGYNSGSQEIDVVAFSRKDNVFSYTNESTEVATGISADCGNNTTNVYIVCSDYMGTCADKEEITDEETNETVTESAANKAFASLALKDIDTLTEIGYGANKDYFPYAVTNPKTMMGNTNFLTGDGQYVYVIDPTRITTAQKIIEDLGTSVSSYNNKSTYSTATVSSEVSGYLSADDDADVRINTYENEMGLPNSSVDDFTVLALGGNKKNYTNEITNYIKMLTNTTADYTGDVAGKYKITVYPCEYDNGNYSIVTDAEHQGLTRNGSNQYIMDDNYADTLQQHNRFTLIDVQFLNPMNSNEIAYHLFVPVLTKKMVKYEFRSAAQGGTKYQSSGYATNLTQTNDIYAGNFDEWMTIYLQFKFTQAEMDDMLSTGKGLNWNSAKQVNFTYGATNHLASSTEFVLLDANCGVDKEYYLTKAGIDTTSTTGNKSIDHIVFSSFKQKNGTIGFTPQTLNDIAGTKIRYGSVVSNGVYIECTNEATKANATVYAYDSSGENKKYFIAYDSETTTGAGYGSRYTLTSSDDVTENYYLSIFAFSDDNNGSGHTNTAYEFTVSSPVTLSGNVTCKRSTYTTSTVYLGNLFKQTMNINAETSKGMAVGDSSISATLTSTVSFDDPQNAPFFQGRLYIAGERLYQGFVVYLKRYDDGNALQPDTLIYGSPDYSYTGTVNGDSTGIGTRNDTLAENAAYIYLEPVEIEIPDYDGTVWQSTHVENLTVTFPNTEEALQREFMPKYNDGLAGNAFSATASLAYNADDVLYSNIKKNGESSQKYYVSAEEKIDLLFEADDQVVDDEYDKYGEQSKNRSSLGINSKYIHTGSKYAHGYGNKEYIEAVASLDTSRIPDVYKQGNYNLVYTLSLWQKQDDPDNDYGYVYVEVPIDTYLSNFKLKTDIDGDGTLSDIVSGDYVTKTVNESGEYVYTFDLDSNIGNWAIAFDQEKEIFDARATFDVKTADEFEEISTYIYANYKLKLVTQLVPKSGTQNLSSYEDSDWIVYTHAKVNAQFVTPIVQIPNPGNP
ncbi:MAG: hypothetical protein IJH82_09695 [Lachnospiraceae bacterium]|nr:hypothetical protein [Lachnospiraceae bacterium]